MGSISNLPSDVRLEILSRLPLESVLDCRLVCKPWRNHVYDFSFSHLHLTRLGDPGKLTFLVSTNLHQQFHYVEYNENENDGDDETPSFSMRKININPLLKNNFYHVIGSYNGLVCVICRGHTSPDYQNAYIMCNPIMREYVVLPNCITVKNPHPYSFYCGFGYLPETNEYKVVRFIYLRGKPEFESIEVYTLGSGNGWRGIGDCGLNSSGWNSQKDHGIFVNESLYWITQKGKIVSFNLADEKFCEILTLPCLSLHENRSCQLGIGVFDGVLWCSIHDNVTGNVDFWLLKKTENQNTMKPEKCFSLTWRMRVDKNPLALTKSGEVLLFSYTRIHSYDLKSSCLSRPLEFPETVYQSIPHINTVISLRALGEEDTRTMG